MSLKNLREFIEEILLEKASSGQRIDAIARRITKSVVEKIKSPEVLQKISSKTPTVAAIKDDELGEFEIPIDSVVINFSFNPDFDPQQVNVDGKYTSNLYKSEIEIFITYPDRPFRVKDIEAIYPLVTGALRHELEHAGQFATYGTHSLPSAPKTLGDFYKYYFDPSEMEAYVSEAHMKARARKSPLSEELDALYDEIMDNADAAGLSLDELDIFEEELRARYGGYAKIRYPMSK